MRHGGGSRNRITRRGLVTAALGLGLAGCAKFSLLPRGVSNLYTLTPKSTFSEALPTVRWQLVIEEPLAGGGLDTARIATSPDPTSLNYFADSRWTERAPKMIQTLLVESFENTGRIVAVGRQAIGLRSDYNLKTEMREFQAESFGDQGRVVRVRINAKLVRQPKQFIIASHSFEAVQPVAGVGMAAVVVAFDDALGAVLKGIVQWTLRQGEADAKRS